MIFNKKMKQARELVIRVSGKGTFLGKIPASVKILRLQRISRACSTNSEKAGAQ